MNFLQSTIESKLREYTDFYIWGSESEEDLTPAKIYLQVPYGGGNNDTAGSKLTPDQLKSFAIQRSDEKNITIITSHKNQIQDALDSGWEDGFNKPYNGVFCNLCGVDCSGLVLYVINEAFGHDNAILKFFHDKADNPRTTVDGFYDYGVAADFLNNASMSWNTKKTQVKDMLPGDIIRFGSEHVGIVYKIEEYNGKYYVSYGHSHGTYGPGLGSVTCDSKYDTLKDGTWYDSNNTYGSSYGEAILKPIYEYVVRMDLDSIMDYVNTHNITMTE